MISVRINRICIYQKTFGFDHEWLSLIYLIKFCFVLNYNFVIFISLGRVLLVSGPLMIKTLVWKPRLPGLHRPRFVLPQYLEKFPFLSIIIWENNQNKQDQTCSNMFRRIWDRNRNNNKEQQHKKMQLLLLIIPKYIILKKYKARQQDYLNAEFIISVQRLLY